MMEYGAPAAAKTRQFINNSKASSGACSFASFISVFAIGAFPHMRMSSPIPLIVERFVPGSGWIELMGLAVYAAVVTRVVLSSTDPAKTRLVIWAFFSTVFFAQLLLGLAGVSRLLMTGALHLPIPAMIIAGPIYRMGGPFFMLILFLTTILLAGPAWCSWFCYLGSWDFAFARSHPAPVGKVRAHLPLRIGILVSLICGAAHLKIAGASPATAAIIGGAFGVVGMAVMLFLSSKTGRMLHCTVYCPIGLAVNILGRINPFRLRIAGSCNECHACIPACRYGALTPETILRRKPGFTCTLCGDCLVSCTKRKITYRFPGLAPDTARKVFVVITVVIHTLFLGFGRI